MPLRSLKLQTLATRRKHFHRSSSAVFVDDAIPQWALYCVCGHKKNDGTMGLGNSWAPAVQPGSGTFGLASLPQHEKNFHAKRFKSHDDVKPEVQTWLGGEDPTSYRQGFEKWISRLDKCLNRDGDYVEK